MKTVHRGAFLLACSEAHATELAWRITQRKPSDVIRPVTFREDNPWTKVVSHCAHCSFCGTALHVPTNGYECVFHPNEAICISHRYEQTWVVAEATRIIREKIKIDVSDVLFDILLEFVERDPKWVCRDPQELASAVIDPF